MMIKAYIMDVNENGVVYSGYFDEIDNCSESIEQCIGGEFSYVHISNNIMAIIRKVQSSDLPVNRAYVKNNEIKDIIRGKVVCVRKGFNGLSSIEDEDIEIIKKCIVPIFELDGHTFISPDENDL